MLNFYYFLIISRENKQLMYDAHIKCSAVCAVTGDRNMRSTSTWNEMKTRMRETNENEKNLKIQIYKATRATHITKSSWLSSMMLCKKTCGFESRSMTHAYENEKKKSNTRSTVYLTSAHHISQREIQFFFAFFFPPSPTGMAHSHQ